MNWNITAILLAIACLILSTTPALFNTTIPQLSVPILALILISFAFDVIALAKEKRKLCGILSLLFSVISFYVLISVLKQMSI